MKYIQVLWHATVISMNLIRFEIWIFLSTSCYVRFYVWMRPFLWLVYMSVSKRACVRISISREKPLHTCLYDCTHLFLCPYFARTSGYGFYNSNFKFQREFVPLNICFYDCTHMFLCPRFTGISGYVFYNSNFRFQRYFVPLYIHMFLCLHAYVSMPIFLGQMALWL